MSTTVLSVRTANLRPLLPCVGSLVRSASRPFIDAAPESPMLAQRAGTGNTHGMPSCAQGVALAALCAPLARCTRKSECEVVGHDRSTYRA